jgi:hypothetical protein
MLNPTYSPSDGQTSGFYVGQLVREEIGRIVADALESGEILRIRLVAARLTKSYPGSPLSPNEIADELLVVGSNFGVPMEI